MSILFRVVVAFVAVIHLYIAWFEIFAWTVKGPEIFSQMPSELFEPTIAMAANQGIYNAFLAAGLIWSLLIKHPRWQIKVARCFLLFVAAAGVFGAITVSPKILVVQTVPASVGILLSFFVRQRAAEAPSRL